MKMKRKGFTLIELMVVIAIIIILAAIAIPNYISMTHRAQASRATSDAAVIATGLEVYKTDIGNYPATIDLLAEYDDLMGNTKQAAVTQATLDQIDDTEETVTYTPGTAPAATWTLAIETKDGQTITRTEASSAVEIT